MKRLVLCVTCTRCQPPIRNTTACLHSAFSMKTRGQQMRLLSRPNDFEIDLGAIAHNVGLVRRTAGPHTQVYAALKANAYGFGIAQVADVVLSSGADAISLVDVQSAISLRQKGINAPILLYGGVPVTTDVARAVCCHRLMPTVLDCSAAETLSSAATTPLPVFVKIDVGLERLGIAPEKAVSFINHLRRLPNIVVYGIYSHLHVPDCSRAYLHWQLGRFRTAIAALEEQCIEIPVKMVASTAVLLAVPSSILNAVDPGHMLFGLKQMAQQQ